MQRRQPKVELTQTELFFPLPIVQITENIVKVANKENQRVSFKIRTNSRGRYNVRPAASFLEAGEEIMIKFSVDPASFSSDSQQADLRNDFFSMEVRFVGSNDDVTSVQAFWKSETRAGDASTKIKLPCKYIDQSSLPERMVLRNTVRQSPRNDATSPREVTGDGQSTDARMGAVSNATATPTASPAAEIPLTRMPAKPANPVNLEFVAEPFKGEDGKGFLKAFLTFTFPLPVVLLFMVLAFAAAFVEEDTIVTRFLDTYVLGE